MTYATTLWIAAIVYVIVIVFYVRQSFASIFHPLTFYLIFHGLVFVVRPIFAWQNAYKFIYQAFGFYPSVETKSTVLLAATLGLVAFTAGCWKSGAEPLLFRQSVKDFEARKRLIPAFLGTAVLLAPMALFSIYTTYWTGYAGMRTNANMGVAFNTSSNGWLYESQLMLVPLSVILAWIFRFRWWAFLPLIVFILARAGTGGRGPFIVALVATGLLGPE